MNGVNTEAKISRFLGQNIPAEYSSIKFTVAIENKIFGKFLSEHKQGVQRQGEKKAKKKQYSWATLTTVCGSPFLCSFWAKHRHTPARRSPGVLTVC